MKKVIYARKSLFDKEELEAAKKEGFDVVFCLTEIEKNSFVIPRFSMYPFVKDQYEEFKNLGAKIINNLHQHFYISDLGNYISDIEELSPQTYKITSNTKDIPFEPPYVLKGQTNSRKNDWSHSMFAKTREDANRIYSVLSADSMIGYQEIFVRKFLELKNYGIGITGAPIAKEFRCFVAYGEVISKGFYWGNYFDDIETKPNVSEVPDEFLQDVIQRVGKNSNFYCIDVAQKTDGEWIVIELNCGMQAGLSMNDPEEFYKNLHKQILRNEA